MRKQPTFTISLVFTEEQYDIVRLMVERYFPEVETVQEAIICALKNEEKHRMILVSPRESNKQ